MESASGYDVAVKLANSEGGALGVGALSGCDVAEAVAALRFDDRGLIPCIVQDAATLEVLMMAWMSEESLRLTFDLGETVFWSRSRNELWHKGAISGNTQKVVDLRYDCDGDTLLALVEPAGPACHTGERSCFYRSFVK